MMRPFFAITAPIGTSSLAAALVARRKASRISAWSSRKSRSIDGQDTSARTKVSESRGTMKKLLVLFGLVALAGTAVQADEQDTVKRSAQILREFRSMPERQVPRTVLRNARGLAIMRVVKVGFVFSGKGGEGVVIARTGNGWSGPSFHWNRRCRLGFANGRGGHRFRFRSK